MPHAALAQSAWWLPANAQTGNIYYNNGNVGVGTSAPGAGLDVQYSQNAALGVAYGGRFQQSLNASAANDSLTALSINPTFNDNGKTGVIHNGLIVGRGNVGIGTSIPFSALHFHASGSNAYVTMSNPVSHKYWYERFADDGNFSISYSADLTNFFNRFMIDTNGNVGIGTTAPPYKLSVNGTIAANEIIVTDTTHGVALLSNPVTG